VDIEFDPAKDEANLAKHGVSLDLAVIILDDLAGEIADERHAYGETRMNAYGFVAGRLFVCTDTLRSDVFRIISVRKANKREQARWFESE
jgi:uncharacterized DUF497 family protein